MRRHHLFAAVLCLFTVTLIGCKNTSYIVVTRGSGTAAAANAGETVIWSTYYPTDPGFTVKFPDGKSPCENKETSIPVTAGHPNGCKIIDYSSSGSKVVYFYYTIVFTPGTQQSQPDNHQQFSVKPCNACATIVGSADSANVASPALTPNATGAAPAALASGATDSNNNPAHLSCPNGKAYADPTAVSDESYIWWDDKLSAGWTVEFGSDEKSPCSNGHTFTSIAPGTSTCNIKGGIQGAYSYIATVSDSSCTASSDPITVTVTP